MKFDHRFQPGETVKTVVKDRLPGSGDARA